MSEGNSDDLAKEALNLLDEAFDPYSALQQAGYDSATLIAAAQVYATLHTANQPSQEPVEKPTAEQQP